MSLVLIDEVFTLILSVERADRSNYFGVLILLNTLVYSVLVELRSPVIGVAPLSEFCS